MLSTPPPYPGSPGQCRSNPRKWTIKYLSINIFPRQYLRSPFWSPLCDLNMSMCINFKSSLFCFANPANAMWSRIYKKIQWNKIILLMGRQNIFINPQIKKYCPIRREKIFVLLFCKSNPTLYIFLSDIRNLLKIQKKILF